MRLQSESGNIFNRFGRSTICAGVAELADAYGSGPYGGNPMEVQVLSPAPFELQGLWFQGPFCMYGAGGVGDRPGKGRRARLRRLLRVACSMRCTVCAMRRTVCSTCHAPHGVQHAPHGVRLNPISAAGTGVGTDSGDSPRFL